MHRRDLALVAGEPGSGKTALVRSLLTRLDSSSFRMLYGAVPVAKNALHAAIEGLLLDLGRSPSTTGPGLWPSCANLYAGRTPRAAVPCWSETAMVHRLRECPGDDEQLRGQGGLTQSRVPGKPGPVQSWAWNSPGQTCRSCIFNGLNPEPGFWNALSNLQVSL
ncbi:MAG: ATP-binding protein [Candidatus Xenobium sp.]